MNTLEVMAVGTKLTIGPNGEFEGTVIQVLINPNNAVCYKIAWWWEGSCKEATFSEIEIPNIQTNQTIGFK